MKDRISSKTGYTLIFTSAALLLALALGVLALTCSAMGSSDAADSVPDGAVTPAPPAESTPAESGSAASDTPAPTRLRTRGATCSRRRTPAREQVWEHHPAAAQSSPVPTPPRRPKRAIPSSAPL